MSNLKHTHRHIDGVTVHIMQYADLALCGEWWPRADWEEAEAEVTLPYSGGRLSRRCVACSKIALEMK